MKYIGPYYLVKFLDREYAEKMLDGELLFRSIEGFCNAQKRNVESSYEFKGDYFGGINYSDGNGMGLIDVLTLHEKIFCMSKMIYDDVNKCFIKPDARMRKFGDMAIIIEDPIEFVRKIVCRMLELFEDDFWVAASDVDYCIDLSLQRPYDEFCKSYLYSYQNEFRIALDLAMGKFHPSELKNITDWARLTFPGNTIAP